MKRQWPDAWLAVVVLGHLIITVLHGRAHDGGHVAISAAQAFFVYSVILAAPLAGLAVSLVHVRAGGAVVAVAMGASLVFGVVNHFVIVSPDHVSQVTRAWRPLFTTTAVLLVASEGLGTVVGLRRAIGSEIPS